MCHLIEFFNNLALAVQEYERKSALTDWSPNLTDEGKDNLLTQLSAKLNITK